MKEINRRTYVSMGAIFFVVLAVVLLLPVQVLRSRLRSAKLA